MTNVVSYRYLRRDLAKLVDENPPAIMLLFEPKGRPEDEGNDFYIQSKKNMCWLRRKKSLLTVPNNSLMLQNALPGTYEKPPLS